MKHMLLSFILLGTFSVTTVIAESKPTSKENTKPTHKPSYNQLSRDDYDYDPYYRDEETKKKQEEAEIAHKLKKKKIKAKQKELKAKQKIEQKALQKKNKAEYDKAMKQYENRKRNTNIGNSIIISDKPI